MSDIKNMKCYCCKCYDSFDGCTAWDCKNDFEISIEKIKQVAEDYGLSIVDIIEFAKFYRRRTICDFCKYNDKEECGFNCEDNYDCFEWRGV